MNNLMLRSISGVFILLMGYGISISPLFKNIFIIILGCLSLYELSQFTPPGKRTALYGCMIIASCTLAFFMRNKVVINILIASWMHDIGGYIFGKWLKGPKIAPSISPNKTWSGFLGGCFLLMTILSFAAYTQNMNLPLSLLVLSSFFMNSICLLGDLWESKLKRLYKKKDSSNLIPGHGGVLDRFDAFFLLILCYGIINHLAHTRGF